MQSNIVEGLHVYLRTMSAIKPVPAPKGGQGGIAALAPNNQSILLDKLNVRRSTPDSEALASSDDEPDNHRQDTPLALMQPQRPVRRASWLNDTSQITLPHPGRKGSFAGSSMSPTTSHPSTPSGEPGGGVWASHSSTSVAMGRGHPPSFPWGTGIWTSERKEPPSRLTEVLPSPTSTVPAGQSFFNSENSISQTSPTPREQGTSSQIPFAIPLHPTPKTYRSQSYSVGQLDPEIATTMPASSAMAARARPVGPPGLQHRPSRPSMLSEMSSEGAMLGKVKEVEDDEESTSDSPQASQQQQADAKTIEMLTRENALLRQQQYQSSRLRPRASTATNYGLGNGYSVHDPVPEESDYAVDELDEMNDSQDPMAKRAFARRMSEYAAGSYRSSYNTAENRKLENVKRAYWQSSLGFGGLSDIPQSRRHSFADVPTRQPSISSMGEAVSLHETTSPDAPQNPEFTGFTDAAAFNTTSPGKSQKFFVYCDTTKLTCTKCHTTLRAPIFRALIRLLPHRPMATHTNRRMA